MDYSIQSEVGPESIDRAQFLVKVLSIYPCRTSRNFSTFEMEQSYYTLILITDLLFAEN